MSESKRPGPPRRLSQPELWMQQRRECPSPTLWVDPEKNVLIGWKNISTYLKIKSWATLYQWVELYGFPAIKRPDGVWMTTMTAIDQWIFLGAEADLEARPHSRGYTKRHDIALRHLANRLYERQARGGAAAPDGPRIRITDLPDALGGDAPNPETPHGEE